MHTTNLKRASVAVAALAAAGAVALFLTLTDSASGDAPASAVAPRSTASATTTVRANAGIQLAAPDAELLRGLDQFFSATIEPLATTADQVAKLDPPVSLEEAARIAGVEVGLGEVGKSTRALLGRVTLGQYGRQLESDPELPSRIDPIVKDAEAWVIVFPSADIPVFGPIGGNGPATVKQPLVVFVDSTTAKFLGAVSY